MDVWELTAKAEGITVQEVLRRESEKFGGVRGEGLGVSSEDLNHSPPPLIPKTEGKGFASAQEFFDHGRKYYAEKLDLEITLERSYPYFTSQGLEFADYVVFRHVDQHGVKRFSQAALHADGRWRKGTPPKERLGESSGLFPLFNLKRVLASQNVMVVEGEKCVEAGTLLGIDDLAFTCNTMGGAKGKAALSDWSALSGKNVWLMADNDAVDEKTGRSEGVAHMEDVREILLKLDPPPLSINRIRHEDLNLEVKGDLYDYLAPLESDEDKRLAVLSLLESAEPAGITKGLYDFYDAVARGELKHIPFHAAQKLSTSTQAIVPGNTVLLCGNPGAGKSFWILEQCWRWYLEQGTPVALLELEKDLVFWQRRMTAQLLGRWEVSNYEWLEANPEKAIEATRTVEGDIEKFSRTITLLPEEGKTDCAWALAWFDEQSRKGAKVCVIDPVTYLTKSKEVWLDDEMFMKEANKLTRRYKNTLVIVTHPKNDAVRTGKPSIADLAGGAAWYRFSDTVLWFHHYHEPQEKSVDLGGSRLSQEKYFHEVRIFKAREGSGAGSRLAFRAENARFSEIGEVVDI